MIWQQAQGYYQLKADKELDNPQICHQGYWKQH